MHSNALNPTEQDIFPRYSGQPDNDVTPAGTSACTPDHKLTAPKAHGFQNEYDRKRGGKPAWADDIACFKKDAARGLKRIGMNKAPGKALVALVSLFAHSVFANEGDFYLSAMKLSNHAGCGRTTANEVLADLKAANAHEVTGCHGGGRVNGRGIAAERWFYLPAILDWLEAEFGKLPKGLKTAFISLNEKLVQKRLSVARNAQQKQPVQPESKCSEADTTKCIEIVDVKTTPEDAQSREVVQAQPEMEAEIHGSTQTGDDTTQTQPTNSPSQNYCDLVLKEGNAAPATGEAQEVEAKSETHSLLEGPNADTSTQDAAEVQELTASNDNHTPTAGNVTPLMGCSRAKFFGNRHSLHATNRCQPDNPPLGMGSNAHGTLDFWPGSRLKPTLRPIERQTPQTTSAAL